MLATGTLVQHQPVLLVQNGRQLPSQLLQQVETGAPQRPLQPAEAASGMHQQRPLLPQPPLPQPPREIGAQLIQTRILEHSIKCSQQHSAKT